MDVVETFPEHVASAAFVVYSSENKTVVTFVKVLEALVDRAM